MTKSIKKQLLNIAFLLLLIVFTLVILLKSNSELNFANIGKFISGSNKWLLFAAVCCMAMAVVCEGLSLLVVSRTFGYKCRLGGAMVYACADYYYSAITPSASGGQPASAYYMAKDGMSVGAASFTLVLNLVTYTAALVILGIIALCIRPQLLVQQEFFPQFLIILGFVIQTLLTAFFVACMFFSRWVSKIGNGIISLLHKIKIIKKPDKWRARLQAEIAKFNDCVQVMREHKLVVLYSLLINIALRVFFVLVSCFVCLAAEPSADFWDIFVLQSLLLVGYVSIPLPGGVGVYEYLYLRLYALSFGSEFILSAMMIVRTINYYLVILGTGLVTLIKHISLINKKPAPQPAAAAEEVGKEAEEVGKEAEEVKEEVGAEPEPDEEDITENDTEKI